MTDSAPRPNSAVADLIGAERIGDPDALRALDLLVELESAELDALHPDPARRERIAALGWWLGLVTIEPDLEPREWLLAQGFACVIGDELRARVKRLRRRHTPEAFGSPPRQVPINDFPDEGGRRPLRAWSSRGKRIA